MQNESSNQQSEEQPSPSEPSTNQIFLTPEFQRNLRTLAKRYRNIRSNLQPIIQELEIGNFLGDRISGIGEGYVVFKVRVRNQDIQKGKSAGYRLIYQLESSGLVLLLTIYSKSEQEDIMAEEIRKISEEFYKNS
jgi:mRNA-degrading endonuclease RelE of RelBE toxin-antitoxin system